MRYDNNIVASYKMVDTCAAEFAATTPYYYSVYGSENEAVETKDKKKVLVLGSGPIRIGQGIEIDFCSVHCTWAFKKEGYETIIINNKAASPKIQGLTNSSAISQAMSSR